MAHVTVAGLALDPDIGLRLIGPAGDGVVAVKSVHVTDLGRPGRYVLPGELVLTNGLWLDTVPASTWAEEVRASGAAGVGFGLSADRHAVPESLVAACIDASLPLLVIPEEISFSAVADVVRGRAAGDEAATLRRQLLRTRRLVQQIAGGGGRDALLALVAAETGLSAAFVGAGGRVLAATGVLPDEECTRAAALAGLHGHLPSAVADDASVFGVPTTAPGSTLLVRAPLRAIGDDARLLVEQVAAYGAFDDARDRALASARSAMAGELIELVLADEIGETAFAARLRSLQLDATLPVAPIAADVPAGTLAYAAKATGCAFVLAQREGAHVLLVQDSASDVTSCLADEIRAAGAEPVLGWSTPACGSSALRRSLVEAFAALRVAAARSAGDRLVHETEIGSHELLLELLEPNELEAYRRAVLGRLEDWDHEHGANLIETLRAFLEQGGRWREAAARLHIHHNTLRYRIDRVESLTGRRLACTGERVDLFLALAIGARGRAHERHAPDAFVPSSTSVEVGASGS